MAAALVGLLISYYANLPSGPVIVIGAGVILTRGTPVYDLVRETVHRAENGKPLQIPENAVVVPGARAVRGDWAGVCAGTMTLSAPLPRPSRWTVPSGNTRGSRGSRSNTSR